MVRVGVIGGFAGKFASVTGGVAIIVGNGLLGYFGIGAVVAF